MSLVHFLTHPDVIIDPDVPVPEWPLSETGRVRMRSLCAAPFVADLTTVAASTERKALDGAEILAEAAGAPLDVDASLGENDRSATGYLPADEFTALADAFFASPDASVRGWETARDAQTRIVAGIHALLARAPDGDVAIVSHGGVGTLLLCALRDAPIARVHDQPGTIGGCGFTFDRSTRRVIDGWRTFEEILT